MGKWCSALVAGVFAIQIWRPGACFAVGLYLGGSGFRLADDLPGFEWMLARPPGRRRFHTGNCRFGADADRPADDPTPHQAKALPCGGT